MSELDGEVRFDRISRAIYSTDASVYQIMPAGVVIPRSRDDVIRTLDLCREYGTSITARGGGTSQAGQAIGPGIQLDFSKYMNRILELNPDEQTVTVEPGIVLDELNDGLKDRGLHLPLDLSTADRATLGGMIANNSAGTRSVIYGKTIDYVLELTVVLSDGSVVRMCPLDDDELEEKCRRDDLEGDCYRIVRTLAGEHAFEIEKRYPKILRRVGGYNLDEFLPSKKPFNLARLMVGSEGTLGLVLEAKLRIVPIPKARVVCVIQFEDFHEAMTATPAILKHNPSAVELIDRLLLDATKGKKDYEPLRDFITGDPAAILIVEFLGESSAELPAKIDALEADLRGKKNGAHFFHRAIKPQEQSRIWKLRKAALGLSMSQRGDAKSISYVEDTAVAPDALHDYVRRFKKILDKHKTEAGFYGHASVGLLHIRPVVNMKIADGIRKFEQIAEEISELVLEFGGALSGEHGDGMVRSPFQRKMFGPALYDAFSEIKTTFDKNGVLNPGKIVGAPPLTENLKFGLKYETREIKTLFDFSDFGGISRAAEQCGGVGACRKSLTGTMCPSYMATKNEADSTRGRANALRLAISGQLNAAGFTDHALFAIMDLCLECKTCKSECPTGVDMARMKSEFLHQYQQKFGSSLRTRCLAQTERLAVWGSRMAPLSNWLVQNPFQRWLNEKLLGIDRRRIPPNFTQHTFLHQWSKQAISQNHPDSKDKTSVAIFVDTFTNYYEPQHAMAAAKFAERLGVRVLLPERVCCGRPLISKGFLHEARRQAAATTRILAPLAECSTPILFCEPSCYSAVRDDHPHLLRGELKAQAQKVADSCLTFEEWANSVLDKQQETQFQSGPGKVLLHTHCHQKALTGPGATINLLARIPGCEVIDLDSGCCGMAGSFGYEKNHYEISKAIAERKLLPAIRKMDSRSIVVAPGFSCRHQIKHFTGVEAHSPMTLLESLQR